MSLFSPLAYLLLYFATLLVTIFLVVTLTKPCKTAAVCYNNDNNKNKNKKKKISTKETSKKKKTATAMIAQKVINAIAFWKRSHHDGNDDDEVLPIYHPVVPSAHSRSTTTTTSTAADATTTTSTMGNIREPINNTNRSLFSEMIGHLSRAELIVVGGDGNNTTLTLSSDIIDRLSHDESIVGGGVGHGSGNDDMWDYNLDTINPVEGRIYTRDEIRQLLLLGSRGRVGGGHIINDNDSDVVEDVDVDLALGEDASGIQSISHWISLSHIFTSLCGDS